MIGGLMNRSVVSSSATGAVAEIVGISDWEMALGDVTNFTKIGGDKHYFTTIPHYTSASQIGKSWMPTRQNQSFMLGQMEADVYSIISTWSIDPISEARANQTLAATNAGGTAVGYMQALARQGVAQRLRTIGLFGLEAGEGIISGANEVDIGNDPQNHTTIKTFSPDWLGRKLAGIIADLDSAMLNTPSEFVILTSNRIYNELHYQRGETSKSSIFNGTVPNIAQFLHNAVESTGRKLKIGKDPLLANANTAKNKDYILILAPGVTMEASEGDPRFNVNSFGLEVKNIPYNTCMDKGQGVEMTYPISYQGTNGDIKQACTAGLVLRDKTVIAVTATFQ